MPPNEKEPRESFYDMCRCAKVKRSSSELQGKERKGISEGGNGGS